jgi:hypothetical protein
MVEYKDMNEDEKRRYRQSQPGWEGYTFSPPTGDRKAAPTRTPKKPKPAPAPKPDEPKPSLKGRLLAGAKDFISGMAEPAPKARGRSHGSSRGRQVGGTVQRWRQNVAANASRATMSDFLPPGMFDAGPVAPSSPRGRKEKKGRRRREPPAESGNPWDHDYIPPRLRGFF